MILQLKYNTKQRIHPYSGSFIPDQLTKSHLKSLSQGLSIGWATVFDFFGNIVLNERTFTDPKFGGEISEYFGIPFNLVYGFADQDASWR